MNRQLQLFFNAWVFFTRLPGPRWVDYSDQNLSRSSGYFSWVGMVLGVMLAGVFCVLSAVFPTTVAVLCCLALSLWLTGAFHEDGLADTFDGLGGGWSRERKLAIMKDSRLGSYGAAALVIVLLLRWQLMVWVLDHQPWQFVLLVLVLAESLSRLVAMSLLWNLEYVADPAQSKSKPLATQFSAAAAFVAALPVMVATVPLWLGHSFVWWQWLLLIVSLVLVRSGMIRTLRWHLGGYTGDTLGAMQQLAVIVIWMVCGVNG
ncbi:adenosylcobinamide-GDP ribazoletransferase [Gynuella sunshinyii]|uniref:Adenosylcobinamide-GDP ribazoletransferase n=1 Tax=Gynuella sunshinyii YC6258 TaxID=1445510 RepID=A0A0C5VJN2_9GAMM|nr:adenosylcobinamide-GDP ribazoletransferase [Gynuella sunshinyii]AJQ93603.1 cobalamin-5-phosphate synthase [Gynuella sunshinyii YC6258]